MNSNAFFKGELKAIVLAGGFGTRLRPLSCTKPKVLFPIANKSIIAWILEGLSAGGVDEVILAVRYLAEELRESVLEGDYGMKIRFSKERKPLGTGGPIRKVEDFLDRDEAFLLMNGDILCDVNYAELKRKHEEKGGRATMVVYEVDDVSRFGVVEIDKSDKISSFVEKPRPQEAPSRFVNAGIYVLDPSIIDLIPRDVSVSLEREVFPKLARKGSLYGYKHDGFWVDIGDPKDYLEANFAMLNKIAQRPVLGEGVDFGDDVKVLPPVIVGEEVKVGRDATIGPHVSIGDGSVLGEGCRIEKSVLFPQSCVDDYSSISGSILGEGATVGKWVKIEDGVIIGEGARVLDNISLVMSVTVCPFKTLEESVVGPKRIM